MSTTFDDLKKKVKTVADATVDATKQLAILSKCKVQIVAEQEKIRSLYTKLGKLYYKDFVTDEEPDEAEYNPLCDSISDHYRKIARLREKMNEAKNNYNTMKREDAQTRQKETEEENRLILLASGTSPSPEDLADEDDLLEELNNLNNDTPYGEILD